MAALGIEDGDADIALIEAFERQAAFGQALAPHEFGAGALALGADYRRRRTADNDLVVDDGDIVDLGTLARIVAARLEGFENQFGVETHRPDMYPAAEGVVSQVMGVVGGEAAQPPSLVEQDIAQRPAVAPVVLDLRSVVIDLDGMGAVDDVGVIRGQAVPFRMDQADEGAGVGGAPGQGNDILALAGGGEVGRQADRQDVPDFIDQGFSGMQLGADEGGEIVAP